jgi:hypothetical protein
VLSTSFNIIFLTLFDFEHVSTLLHLGLKAVSQSWQWGALDNQQGR